MARVRKQDHSKKVLILYTGGTFGMDANLKIPKLKASSLRGRLLKAIPELTKIAHCDVEIIFNRDSAHMGPNEWIELANQIQARWKNYEGVVVLHGTDTLAYTASALSFLLRPCLKPVVITGAQRPLASLLSDARRNLLSAVEIAANGPRPLVNQITVFFDDRLLQGNRTRKRSALDFDAFESPDAQPLAWSGADIRYSRGAPGRMTSNPVLSPSFDSGVAVLHVTPGFPSEAVERMLPNLSALLLVVFSSGTAPTHDPEFLGMLRTAKKQKLPIILVTEGASESPVRNTAPKIYEAGKTLLEEGCVWAGAMTPECAYVKASLILGQKASKGSFERFLALWKRNLAGEAQ